MIPAFSVDDGSGAFDLLIIEVGIAPARVEGADDHLVASHETSDVIFIVDIALLGVKLRMCLQLFRIPHDGGDIVAPIQGFLQDGRSDKAGCSDQGNLHGVLPSARASPKKW